MRRIIAFLAVSISAYALSFSTDSLLGALVHYYTSAAYLPAATWFIIACIAGFTALALWPGHPALAIPSALIAVIALIGGIVGHHYNFGVCAIMLMQAGLIWFATHLQASNSFSG
jgi:hypothetical protein